MEAQQIKQKLPQGSVNEIARKTGLSITTVSNVLKGKARRSPSAATVYRAAAEYLTDYNLKKAEAMQALNEAMSDETPGQLLNRIDQSREKYGAGTSPLH